MVIDETKLVCGPHWTGVGMVDIWPLALSSHWLCNVGQVMSLPGSHFLHLESHESGSFCLQRVISLQDFGPPVHGLTYTLLGGQ